MTHIPKCISYIAFHTTDRGNKESVKLKRCVRLKTLNAEEKVMPPHQLLKGSNKEFAPWILMSWTLICLRGKAAHRDLACSAIWMSKVSYKRCPIHNDLLRGNSVQTGLTGSSKQQETMTWEHQHKSFSITASTPFYVSIKTHNTLAILYRCVCSTWFSMMTARESCDVAPRTNLFYCLSLLNVNDGDSLTHTPVRTCGAGTISLV